MSGEANERALAEPEPGLAEHPSPFADEPSFRLAFRDPDFLLRNELRGVRLLLELMKADIAQDEAGIRSTVVLFGSARVVDRATAEARLAAARTAEQRAAAERALRQSQWYEEARRFARLVTGGGQRHGICDFA